MEIYIIRHAQSTNNALADQTNRVVDPPLTELGERQAELLAEHLARGWQPRGYYPAPLGPEIEVQGRWRRYGLTRLYCSPMLRSMQTAQPVARGLDLVPQVWVDIHEQGGMFLEEGEERLPVGKPGMARAEILARFPDYVLPQVITDNGWYGRDDEDWPACHDRAMQVATTFRRWAAEPEYQNERIAIISHGGFADALLKALLHGGPRVNGNGSGNGPVGTFFYQHFNVAIDHLSIHTDTFLRVAYLNRIEHLPADMIT